MRLLTTALVASTALCFADTALAWGNASYSADMTMNGEGHTQTAKLYRTPTKMRMDMNMEGQDASTIMDFQTGQTTSMVDMGMGAPVVMQLDVSQYADLTEDPTETGTRTGRTKTVSGESCEVWTHEDAEACITSDGIMMEAISPDGSMTLSNVKRGTQDASLFVAPQGGMDLGALMGDAMKDMSAEEANAMQDVLGGLFGD